MPDRRRLKLKNRVVVGWYTDEKGRRRPITAPIGRRYRLVWYRRRVDLGHSGRVDFAIPAKNVEPSSRGRMFEYEAYEWALLSGKRRTMDLLGFTDQFFAYVDRG